MLAGEAVLDAWPGGVTNACKAQVVAALGKTMPDREQTASCTVFVHLPLSRRPAATLTFFSRNRLPATQPGLFATSAT